ncbi:MAG: DedA family protein [Planctomycetales bacterium]|nr:DedA family protein [Planctomycetales bacterium]
MEHLRFFIDLILHLDTHLGDLITQFGPWIYGLMFLIVFCETGLVVTPILPGDSLLFALGTFAGMGRLDLTTLLVLLIAAAILGDSANYWLGSLVGPRIFRGENVRFLNRKHLDRTHEFFERYGAKTIIIARFVPIVRTFAPFVAGMGRMTYRRFMVYNVAGGIVWVVLFVLGGYFFGSREFVKKNFTLVILGIIVVSVLPAVFEFVRERRRLRLARSGG